MFGFAIYYFQISAYTTYVAHLNHHRNGDISYPIANQSGY